MMHEFSPHTDSIIFMYIVRKHPGCSNKRCSTLFLNVNIHDTTNVPWVSKFSLILLAVINRCEVYTQYTSKIKLIVIKTKKDLSNPTSILDEIMFLTIKYIKKKIPIVKFNRKKLYVST